MRILLPRAKAADPNFAIGLGLIVALAAAEIFAATFYYFHRMHTARTSGQAVAMARVGRPALSPTEVALENHGARSARRRTGFHAVTLHVLQRGFGT